MDEETMLIKVSASENNNKFYCVQLSGDTVTVRWGRVGSKGTTTVYHGGRAVYDSTVRQKIAKGYKKTEIVTGTSSREANNLKLSSVAKKVLLAPGQSGGEQLENLIEKLVRMNAHEISVASSGKINVSESGQISTPLGLVTSGTITQAEKVLFSLERQKSDSSLFASLLEEYLTLVPQKVAARKGWESTFFNEENTFSSQKSFLSQLSDSLTWYENQAKLNNSQEDDESTWEEKYADLFRLRLHQLDTTKRSGRKTFAAIDKKFKETISTHHSSRNLKLKNVYVVTDTVGANTFDQACKTVGNTRSLWHGTRAFNVLSILRQSLYVPPVSSSFTTGRMFGDGVYFAKDSTKSLNYSLGYWSGARENNCFMFLSDVALGHEFHPRTMPSRQEVLAVQQGTQKSRFGKTYDSIHVRAGSCGVRNDEFIVWNTDNICLSYLCEFDA